MDGTQTRSPVPTYLPWSIFTTLCCCLPLGIAAIVCSTKASGANSVGDTTRAQEASRTAKILNIVGLPCLSGPASQLLLHMSEMLEQWGEVQKSIPLLLCMHQFLQHRQDSVLVHTHGFLRDPAAPERLHPKASPVVRRSRTWGGRRANSSERCAALLCTSACAASCSSVTASLSCLSLSAQCSCKDGVPFSAPPAFTPAHLSPSTQHPATAHQICATLQNCIEAPLH
ncbi:hypothetical protein JZ751_002309 [Albula glossodonta]|uniref:Uncharacterized protein n=1 Tax=Albula glossodonta TaxID=121402 RepID=A0A8T2P508_9TELE|nr:hypothetical protein JZ751_002309 [Albula glossodonta]